jgi:hypothetical protein
MSPFSVFACSALAVASVAGCASAPSSAQLPVPVVLAPAPAPAAETPQGPTAIYRNPRIGKVYLRAHEDASGRLLGPQVVYQVIEPGGWNVSALEQGEPRAADPRLREGPGTVMDPAAGWMLEPEGSTNPPPPGSR